MNQNTLITYERDAINSYLVLQSDTTRVVQEYEVEMIKRNPIDSFLDLHIQEVNSEVKVYYNITSKQKLLAILERKKLSYMDMYTFFSAIMAIMKDCNKYLLSSLKINLEIDHIFVSPHNCSPMFMYVPYEDEANDVHNDLRELIHLFFEKVNQDDVKGVMMIHRLYTASKGDDFDLSNIEAIMQREEMNQQGEIQHKESTNQKAIIPEKKVAREVSQRVSHSNHKDIVAKNHHEVSQHNNMDKKSLENDDRQVIDQLIKRNKQRQEVINKKDKSVGTDAFGQRNAFNKKNRKSNKRIEALEEKESKPPREKNELPICYLMIGCIQLVVIGAFLGLVKSGVLNNETDGSLRMDGVLASIVMLTVINLYASKKIYEHNQRKGMTGNKKIAKTSINMHKEKVYNEPKVKPKKSDLLKQQIHSFNKANRDVSMEQDGKDIEADLLDGGRSKRHSPFNHVEHVEQVVRNQTVYDDEDTQLLDVSQYDLVQESRAYLVKKSGDIVDKIILTNNPFIIGKLRSQVDYVMDNSSVSRMHCKIIEKEGQYFILDLNSKNGTYLDEEPLDSNREYPLFDGSMITISNCMYTFEIG